MYWDFKGWREYTHRGCEDTWIQIRKGEKEAAFEADTRPLSKAPKQENWEVFLGQLSVSSHKVDEKINWKGI